MINKKMPIVVISGGTGLVGKKLSKHLTSKGYNIIILTREKNKQPSLPGINYSFWNVEKQIIDREIIKTADYIIHLAGAGVMDKRWTKSFKRKIVESRTKSAELIISCLKDGGHHVKAFVSASAIGWYGEDKNKLQKDGFTETDLPAKDFLGDTCVLWEAAADEANPFANRVVKLRTGIVLSSEGGAFKEFKDPLRFGIAPILGGGRQIISWIHIDDLCRIYSEALENNDLKGSYNAVAPGPVSQKSLETLLARKVKNKFYTSLYVPKFILKLMMGKKSIEILKSATVSCNKIKSAGFTFLYPSIEAAINELTGEKG